jgi:CRISPR/Cas system CSM-associated protein Csm3 (group 7 of RAMP superfamily)
MTCLTFGSTWLSSKVLVRDLLVDRELWFEQFHVRNGVAIDRDTETADEGKLYDYEVIPSGVRFQFRLLVENGEPWQWGMVLTGLRAFQGGGVAIGGSKSRGLGWVKLELNERRLLSLDGKGTDERIEKLFSFIGGGGFEPVSDEQEKDWVNKFRGELSRRAKEVQA